MRSLVWLIPCPQCKHVQRVQDNSLFGQQTECPMCAHEFVLEQPRKLPHPHKQIGISTSYKDLRETKDIRRSWRP